MLQHGWNKDMQDEKSQSQYCMIPLIQDIQNSQINRNRKQNGGYQGSEGRGKGSYCLMGTEHQFYKI